MTPGGEHNNIEHASTQLQHMHIVNPETGATLGCCQVRIITLDNGETIYSGHLIQYYADLPDALEVVSDFRRVAAYRGLRVDPRPVE